jgi:hypothetical protein
VGLQDVGRKWPIDAEISLVCSFVLGVLMHYASNSEEWKSIAEQITKETDSAKLTLLVKQLCDVLDQAHKPTGSTERSD